MLFTESEGRPARPAPTSITPPTRRSKVDVTLQLPTKTWQRLASRPRERELVTAVWGRLEELDNIAGEHHLEVVAALRFVLVHHQPTTAGRCSACRRKSARHLWRRRPWPCAVWIQVHYELIGPFAGGGHHRQG